MRQRVGFLLPRDVLERARGDVLVVGLACTLEKETSYEEIGAEVVKRSEGDMKGLLGLLRRALVRTGFETNPTSGNFEAKGVIVSDPIFLKVAVWYDNELDYPGRGMDLIKHMATSRSPTRRAIWKRRRRTWRFAPRS